MVSLSSGDVYGLSGLILSAALLSPQTPNQLLLGYLDHALATQTVSHAAVLQAVASFNDQAGKKGPFCLQALLNLAQLSLGHVTARGKPEECLNLSVSILKIMHWLLKILLQVGALVHGLGNKKRLFKLAWNVIAFPVELNI